MFTHSVASVQGQLSNPSTLVQKIDSPYPPYVKKAVGLGEPQVLTWSSQTLTEQLLLSLVDVGQGGSEYVRVTQASWQLEVS